VHLADLALRAIDILGLVRPDNAQAMTELDDRVLDFVIAMDQPRPDAKLGIQYMDAADGLISVFAFSALVRSLKSLLARSRSLRASDAMLRSDATVQTDSNASVDRSRISTPLMVLSSLSTDVTAFIENLTPLLADTVANRDAIIDGVDGSLTAASQLLERASRFGVTQAGWGFITDWKRAAFADLITAVAALVTRWDGKLTDVAAKLAAYNALPAGTSDDDRFKALRAAEFTVSTVAAPLPATPADLLAIVQTKIDDFTALRDQFDALTSTADPSFAHLIAAVEALLPITGFDSQPFDVSSFGDRAIVVAEDLMRVMRSQDTALRARLASTQAQLDARDNAATASAQTKAMSAAAKALFGDEFTLYPEFPIDPAQGAEWDAAYNASNNGALFNYLTQTAKVDFPVDEWLAGVARVRPAVHAWEAVANLTSAFSVEEPKLTPMQLPFDPAAPWVAMPFPSTYDLSSDRLLYTAQYPAGGFDPTLPQCGMLLDEWSELVSAKDKAANLVLQHTGITFNYDRPNSEPPQSILLVTPATANEQWQWDDLVGALNETLDLAKKRALEPVNLDQNAYARFLPAWLRGGLTGLQVAVAGILAAASWRLVRSEAPSALLSAVVLGGFLAGLFVNAAVVVAAAGVIGIGMDRMKRHA
jgi:hypothetical protein